MPDRDLVEAAARALANDADHTGDAWMDWDEEAEAVVAALKPLIEAAVLESVRTAIEAVEWRWLEVGGRPEPMVLRDDMLAVVEAKARR